MRKCRFCAKDIQDASRVCEHCGKDLVPAPAPAPAAIAVPSNYGKAVPVARDPDVSTAPVMRVTVVDIDMPAGSMVVFMVKWAVAAIPAFIILAVIGVGLMALMAFFAALF